MIDDFVEHKRSESPVEENLVTVVDEFPGIEPDTTDDQTPESPAKPEAESPKPKSSWYKLSWPPNRNEWILSVVLVLVAAGCIGYYLHSHLQSASFKLTIYSPVHQIVVTTVPSTLTGLPVSPTVNQRPVTAVMIENSTDARPQSGLAQAGVVFEALAEGGITRFMAIYQDTQPSYIGPVRSARPYYISWELGFNASYAHVGGSPEALTDITNWGVHDLNQFYNGNSYERISSRDAPHNVYTSVAQLNDLEISKGYTSSSFTGFPRNAKATPAKTPTATSIALTFSSSDYNVNYTYDPTANDYQRFMGGQPDIDVDANGNQTQVAPKVVVVMIVPQSQGSLDATGAYYTEYATVGNGPVYVFQDGNVVTGTWQKSSNNSQITFTDSNGKVLKLDPGQTWISVLGDASDVSYQT